jgi:hypothetical protein
MAGRSFQRTRKNRKIVGNFLITFLIIFALAGFAALTLNFGRVNAQFQYEATGSIASTDTNFYVVQGVQEGDLLLVSVNPIEGGSYFSQLLAPNLTQVQYHTGMGGNPVSGTHSYQLIADASGNYLLTFWTEDSAFNYTVTSSHSISTGDPPQSTPYKITGQIHTSETKYQKLQGVQEGDLLLVSVNPIEGGSYFSQLLAPNLTQVQYYTEIGGNPVYGAHRYHVIADTSGDYLVKFWTRSSQFNYTVKSSHLIAAEVLQTPSATPSIIPTPSPTASPTSITSPPSAPPSATTPTSPTFSATPFTINAVASGSVTFEVPTTYQNSGANFTYDFGDGTNITTPNTSVTHVYQEPGNYTFTLKLEGTPEQRAIETYSVIVTGPSENPIIKYTWPIVTSVTAGLTVAAITAVLRSRKKKTQPPNPPPPPPPK